MSKALCKICGEPMPEGEQMFHYHGYSGPCPKPPLPLKKVELDVAGQPKLIPNAIELQAYAVLNGIKAAADGGFIQLPVQMRMDIDVVLMAATARRIGMR